MQVEVVARQKRTALLNNFDVVIICFSLSGHFALIIYFLCTSIKISFSMFVVLFVQ